MPSRSAGSVLYFRFRTGIVFLAITLQSCSSLRAPVEQPSFSEAEYRSSNRDGLILSARPVVTAQEYWELFDDNLPEIGICAAWIRIRNNGQQDADLAGTTWSLLIGEVHYKLLKPSQVLERYYKGRHIRMYTVSADRQALRNLEALEFHGGQLNSREENEGFIFFQMPPTLANNWVSGATLASDGIRLANKTKISFRLPLTYANP
jgi:hypothetical protein